MKQDDEPVGAPRIGASPATADWPEAAQVVREAAFKRLGSFGRVRDRCPVGDPDAMRSGSEPRSVDDEPAALVYDSDLDADMFAAVRASTTSARQLTFKARDLELEMELSGAGRLVGQVVPPQAAEVEVRHRGGTIGLETDELGFFHLGALPPGPVSFRCRPVGRTANSVATSWITL